MTPKCLMGGNRGAGFCPNGNQCIVSALHMPYGENQTQGYGLGSPSSQCP